MRLNSHQTEVIRQAAQEAFGRGVELRLFGSRVDDAKKGGDIDLYIATTAGKVEDLIRAEIAFMVKVKSILGDQKIDLVVDYPNRRHRPPIFDIARRTGVPL